MVEGGGGRAKSFYCDDAGSDILQSQDQPHGVRIILNGRWLGVSGRWKGGEGGATTFYCDYGISDILQPQDQPHGVRAIFNGRGRGRWRGNQIVLP